MKWLLLVSLVSACHGVTQMPPKVPTANELLADVQAHQQQARTRKAQAKVEFWDNTKGDRLRGNLSMWVTRDGRLRIDVDSQVGLLSALAVNGDNFQLLDVKNDKYFTGQAAPCNVERVLHVALPPAQVAAALLGDAPLFPHEGAEVSWNGKDARWVLTLKLAGGNKQTVELSDRQRNVERSELTDQRGKKIWWLEHEDWKTVKGVAMPERSRFQQGDKADQDVILKFTSQDVNVEPPAEAWVIEAPNGLMQQELRCNGS